MTEFEEKNNDAEIPIVDLKNQFREAKNDENNLEQQLKKREQELEKYEVELILLRKKANEESFQSKFKRSPKTQDDILICQRSSKNKARLGYDNGKKKEQSSFINKEGNKKNYVDALMRPVVKEYSKKIAPSQNESRTDNVQADINNSFWEIVMPVIVLEIKQ